MQRSTTLRVLALAGAVLALGAGAAVPAEARPDPRPTVDLHTAAPLAPDGRSLTVQLFVSCPERWTVTQAAVRVTQPQASGQASFTFPCIGPFPRGVTVTVPATSGTFSLGRAQAAATVVVARGGRTQQAQDSDSLFVQPTVLADLAETARIDGDGSAVTIGVTVACPVGAIPQQSYVNVTQGQTATGNASYVPVCDGAPHTFTLRVPASSGTFVPGAARALTFAVVEHDGIGTAGVDDVPITLVS